ncbi:MAG: hypothetical protein AAF497_29600 [Planctomycetota bacterium]
MYVAVPKPLHNATHYHITYDDKSLKYSEVIAAWKTDDEFRQFFINLLTASPYSAFRWETTPITKSTVDREFEFVLIDTPSFATRRTDTMSFQDQFDTDTNEIIVFTNLGGDATLVVPSPRAESHCYGHLAAFLRTAPATQVHELWRVTANTIEANLNNRPLWISTAGGGVAWLHVRLDKRPKYYSYVPYRTA